MYLKDLIAELEKYDPSLVIPRGFGGYGHSDRGSYADLAFPPKDNVEVGDMLTYAKAMMGQIIHGYKGGEYRVTGYTTVLIGEDSSQCGEHLSPLLIEYMIAAAKSTVPSALDLWIARAEKAETDREEIRAKLAAKSAALETATRADGEIIAGLRAALETMTKDRDAWKSDSLMWSNAWERELSGYYWPKTHRIDSAVVSTRKIIERLRVCEAELAKGAAKATAAGAKHAYCTNGHVCKKP